MRTCICSHSLAITAACADHYYFGSFRVYINLDDLDFCNSFFSLPLNASLLSPSVLNNFIVSSFQVVQNVFPTFFFKHSVFVCKSPILFQSTYTHSFHFKAPFVSTHFHACWRRDYCLSKTFEADEELVMPSRSSVSTDAKPFALAPQVQAQIEKNKQEANHRKEVFKERQWEAKKPWVNPPTSSPPPQSPLLLYHVIGCFEWRQCKFCTVRARITDMVVDSNVPISPPVSVPSPVRSGRSLCDVIAGKHCYNHTILKGKLYENWGFLVGSSSKLYGK